MLQFQQNQEFNNNYGTVTHLLDYANQIGLDTSYVQGLDSTTDQETLVNLQAMLEQALAEELAKQEKEQRYACHIGPYANGICTICGGRQP